METIINSLEKFSGLIYRSIITLVPSVCFLFILALFLWYNKIVDKDILLQIFNHIEKASTIIVIILLSFLFCLGIMTEIICDEIFNMSVETERFMNDEKKVWSSFRKYISKDIIQKLGLDESEFLDKKISVSEIPELLMVQEYHSFHNYKTYIESKKKIIDSICFYLLLCPILFLPFTLMPVYIASRYNLYPFIVLQTIQLILTFGTFWVGKKNVTEDDSIIKKKVYIPLAVCCLSGLGILFKIFVPFCKLILVNGLLFIPIILLMLGIYNYSIMIEQISIDGIISINLLNKKKQSTSNTPSN